MTVTITKQEEHIGARVEGVDLTSLASKDGVSAICDALFENSVLLFHDQDITDEDHVSLTERLGPIQLTMASDPYGGGGPSTTSPTWMSVARSSLPTTLDGSIRRATHCGIQMGLSNVCR